MQKYFVKTPELIKKVFSKITWSLPSQKSTIYLTFDDGPIPQCTIPILDILDKYKAKASFFCVGENVEKHPEIFKRIKESGHTVANHSYSHLSGWKSKDEEYIKDVKKGADIIGSNLFRPPYGRISKSQLDSLSKDYQIIMWDVLTGDFDENNDPKQCFDNVLKNTKKGSILVFHDNIKSKEIILELLPMVLSHYSALGYQFEALETSVSL